MQEPGVQPDSHSKREFAEMLHVVLDVFRCLIVHLMRVAYCLGR
jgi:hypothetical protein